MRLTVDGLSINLATGGVDGGDGPPVLLVHGAGMDRTVWQLQTRYLAHHGFRALAVDLPGHGASDGPPLTDVAALATFVAHLIDEIDEGPVDLVGHSLGALVSLEVAAAAPAAVRRLVLLGAAAAMPVHPELLDAARRNDVLAAELMTAWGHGQRAYVETNPTPGLWMVGGGQALLERAAPGVIATDLAAANAWEAGDVASRVTCPVTVLVGEADRMTPPRAVAPLIAGLSDVDVIHLPGVGHSMMSEAPDQVRAALVKALS